MTHRIHNLGQRTRRLSLAALLALTILAGGGAAMAVQTQLGDSAIARAIVRTPGISGATQAAPSDEGLALLCPGMPRCHWQ